jgi:hypothetical protein
LLERIENESFWLRSPAFADVFVGSEALQCFEPPPVIVGVDEVGEVALELVVTVIVITFDGGFFDRPVHALDLAVGPRMLDLG